MSFYHGTSCWFTLLQGLEVAGLCYPCFDTILPQQDPDSRWSVCMNMWLHLCVRASVWMWTPCRPTVFPGNLCHLLVSWAAAHSVAVYRLLCCSHRVGFTGLWFRHSVRRSKILVPFLVYWNAILVNKTRPTLWFNITIYATCLHKVLDLSCNSSAYNILDSCVYTNESWGSFHK